MSDYLELLSCLHRYLPDANLLFQTPEDCAGLELLLIQPDYDDRSLSRAQIELLSDDPPYWIFCWASGRALAHRILRGGVDVSGKAVVDFGSGSGVVAIAACMAGARTVYACDIDEVCCRLIACNAERNNVALNIVRSVDEIVEPIDLVCAADVLYEKANLAFLELMLGICDDVMIADSRLKSLPDTRFIHVDTVQTTSFPDFKEAKANCQVKLYRSLGRGWAAKGL